MIDLSSLIYGLHEKLSDSSPRKHLGASLIGDGCKRRLWYIFRHAYKEQFSGRMLRLFETGHLEEARLLKELRTLGFEVVDRENGAQLRFKRIDGHFAGSIDGKIKIDGEWYLLEIKTHNKKNFEKLRLNGVRASFKKHFAQIQVYLSELKLKACLYIAVNKDSDEIYVELVQASEKIASDMRDKALEVITSEDAPERLSFTHEECKYCAFKKPCHNLSSELLPEFNCRTCINSTPSINETWSCVLERSEVQLQAGCSSHQFIPSLIPGNLTEYDLESGSVFYKTIEGKTIINQTGKGLKVIA